MLEFSLSFNRSQKNVRFPENGATIGRVKLIPLTREERLNRRGIIFEGSSLSRKLEHLDSKNKPADRIWEVDIEKNPEFIMKSDVGDPRQFGNESISDES